MLLINLTTIYQGRIPTLIHTQHHAESLSRSHLRYVITGELDAYVTSLIHDLTPTLRSPKTYHTRRERTRQTPNTNNDNASPLPTPTSSHKRPHTTTETQTPHQLTPPTASQKPPKKPVNATPPPHKPTRPQNIQRPLIQAPT